MADIEARVSKNGSEERISPLSNQKRLWYRSTLFNACVIGGVGFLAPGLWNAMNSLGAGGAESPYLINAANSLVFGLMGFFCLFGGPIANTIGLSYTLLLGAIGYPIYAAGLYTNNRFGNEWFVLLGAVACGISAGLFWASEGAIALGYPEPTKRAKYLNIWVWFRTLGPIVGGAIVLGLNVKTSGKGSVGYVTYLIFIVLQCLAAPLALALSPPHKVQRSDGSQVIVKGEASIIAEFRALYQTSRKRNVLLLLPIFWAAYFNQYSGNFQAYYFSVRARALLGFLSNFATLFSSLLLSQWLDWTRFPVSKRLEYGYYYVVAAHILSWIYGWVVSEQYTANPPLLDWSTPGFVKGFFVLFLWSFSQQAAQSWLYYLVATMTDNVAELTRLTGILRGQESFAQAISYGLNTRDWYGGRVPLAVNTILLGLAVVPTYLVVRSHNPDETVTDPAAKSLQINDELFETEKQ
ncbi:major facilitator superfamily domain-containing protein [Trichoderma barbatum]